MLNFWIYCCDTWKHAYFYIDLESFSCRGSLIINRIYVVLTFKFVLIPRLLVVISIFTLRINFMYLHVIVACIYTWYYFVTILETIMKCESQIYLVEKNSNYY